MPVHRHLGDHLPSRPRITGYLGRTGITQDSSAISLLEGFVAVALN